MNKLVLSLVSVLAAVSAGAAENPNWKPTDGTIDFTTMTPSTARITLVDRAGSPVDGAAVGQPGVTPAKAYEKGKGPSADAGGFWGALLWLPNPERPNDWQVVRGKLVSGGTSYDPVIYKMNGVAGTIRGPSYMVENGSMTTAYTFKIAAFYGVNGTLNEFEAQVALPPELAVLGMSAPFTVKLGGEDQALGVPPATAGNTKSAQSFAVAVPEPSVLALGVLGLGAFLLRRRS